MNIKENHIIETEISFINRWNKAFAKTFKWKLVNEIAVVRDYWLKKIKFVAPWHPTTFIKNKVLLNTNNSIKKCEFFVVYSEFYAEFKNQV